jgi:hypothetical protein
VGGGGSGLIRESQMTPARLTVEGRDRGGQLTTSQQPLDLCCKRAFPCSISGGLYRAGLGIDGYV